MLEQWRRAETAPANSRRNQMFKLPVAAACLITATAVAAQAQAPAANQLPPSRVEVVQKLDEEFNRVDTNNDGFLGRDEINAAGQKAAQQAQQNVDLKVEEEFKKLDADKNGQLNLTEFRAAAKVSAKAAPDQALQRFDSNKDGRISSAEFRAQTLAGYDKADLNKDGKITADEVAKAQGR
jgi:Ca2+-binding EF-hand superfamily protein